MNKNLLTIGMLAIISFAVIKKHKITLLGGAITIN
jgi:hypothetical protein